mmetsp:Transcript_37210/g.76267  ORF Transcript_37210/g.76267 Transcript_37210/m.76267 type:complete len:348 (+) Transcript_37210:50-1093(+)
MSLYAGCPGCLRVFRPKSTDPESCWKSVKTHVLDKAKICSAHKRVKERIFQNNARASCPVCAADFQSSKDACLHLSLALDEAHTSFRDLGNQSIGNQANGENQQDESFRQQMMERMMASKLYSAAKAGRAAEVRECLGQGTDPNGGGEDGYTPLMTASEAGHEEVVDVLLRHRECKVNERNSYGQSALCLAAINGQVSTSIRLLQAEGVDVECVGGGLSIAQKTRRAGYDALADILAKAGKDAQIAKILNCVMEGEASGDFDSISQRISLLTEQLSAKKQNHDDDDPLFQDQLSCSVCLCNRIDTLLMPCNHACMCHSCAVQLAGGTPPKCPICRRQAAQMQRIYFP